MSGADSPFHAGERAIQAQAGLRDRVERTGERMIRPLLPDQHREFYPLLPLLLVGSVDEESGRPTASILAGPPGFIRCPDEQTMLIGAVPEPDDALASNLRVGASVGLLGIQAHAGRRNRANGVISARTAGGFALQISQSFGNCPKFIHPREARYAPRQRSGPTVRAGALGPRERALVARADTLFLASAHPDAHKHALEQSAVRAHGVDVSHRGGPAGFVEVVDDGTLTIPDYRGNGFFNTLGNIHLHPLAGLLFVDMASGDALQLWARAAIRPADAGTAGRHPGAERLVCFEILEVCLRPGAVAICWVDRAHRS